MTEAEQRLLMLIDNESRQVRLISALASRIGWRTVAVPDGETAIAALGTGEGTQIGAIILDQWIPKNNACALIAALRERRPTLPIVVLTNSTSPQLSVEVMRAGATDYLLKPVAAGRLVRALHHASAPGARVDELTPLTEKLPSPLGFDAMVGTASSFRAALARAAKAARGHGPVLIEGESGTGKEMLVRAMHAASARARTGLRMISIAGMSAATLESSLFGHEKDAFAGAFNRQTGALQLCDGGTLVLDEIDHLPLALQDRLAETLATGQVRPVGATHSFKVDARVIAASDTPLNALVAAGRFRPELLKALSSTNIVLPPLRDRTGDIPALTRHFLARIAEQPGLRPLGITEDALHLLAAYQWPGNVRQLQAALFRAAVFCDGNALTRGDFPQLTELIGEKMDRSSASPEGAGVQLYALDGHLRSLEEIEADVIRLAIGHYRGRMTEVARRLGIGRSTLYRKLGDLGIGNAA